MFPAKRSCSIELVQLYRIEILHPQGKSVTAAALRGAIKGTLSVCITVAFLLWIVHAFVVGRLFRSLLRLSGRVRHTLLKRQPKDERPLALLSKVVTNWVYISTHGEQSECSNI